MAENLTPQQVTDIESHLRDRGLDPKKTQVIIDKENNIATFLLYNLSGQIVGYQRYNPNGDKKDHTNSLAAKYFTWVTKESEKTAKLAVWGTENIDPNDPNLFVTEGIFDAVKLKNAGHPVIAVLGNNPKILKTWLPLLNKQTIAVIDNDDAGRALASLTDKHFTTPAPFKDLGEMSQEQVNKFLEDVGFPPKVTSGKGKTLFVSDFDDTLAQTDSKIYLTRNGEKTVMNPAQFATYEAQPGDQFDFSEFDQLINPKPIERFVKLIKQAASGKADKVVVLTARGHTLPVSQFLKMHGIESGVAIAALGDANPQKKADYIQKQIEKDGYNRVAFIDDSKKNVDAVKLLRHKFPNVKILAHQAKEHPSQPVTQNQKGGNIEVRPVTKDELATSKDHILNKHYIRRWPKAVQAVLGVFKDGKQVGTLLYGIGTRAQSAREIFQNEDGTPAIQNNQMWELQRAFTTDEAKKEVPNLGSMVISRGNEWIRQNATTKDGKPVKAIISYADSSAGHKGSVYQSTNATYLGEQRPLPFYVITNPQNGNYARRSKITSKEMQILKDKGFTVEKMKPEAGKHKFVYALGKDQNERDQLLAKIVKPIFDYPKDGEPPKQIPNQAKERLSKKPTKQPQNATPEKKRDVITKLLNSKVKNPETGNDILVKTALKYDKSHPSYKQAKGMVMAYSKKHGINVKPTR